MISGEAVAIIIEIKVYNKCNVLESSPSHPPPQVHEKKVSSMKPVSAAENVGDH